MAAHYNLNETCECENIDELCKQVDPGITSQDPLCENQSLNDYEGKEETDVDEISTVTGAKSLEQPESESEEVLENPCQPCLSEEKNIESKKYCAECNEYLCEICITFHKKFGISKKHRLVSKSDVNQIGMEKLPLKCQIHEKDLACFCPSHDTVCCSTCKAFEHTRCSGVKPLIDAVTEVKDNDEFEEVTTDLQECTDSMTDMLIERKKDYERVLEEKSLSLEKLEEFRNKYVAIVDELKRKEEMRINEKHEEVSLKIKEDIVTFEEIISTLTEGNKSLNQENVCNVNRFIQTKRNKHNIKKVSNLSTDLSARIGTEKVQYKEDNQILTTFENLNALGTLWQVDNTYCCVDSGKTEFSFGNCSVAAIYILGDEYLIVTDWDSRSLKLINLKQREVINSVKFDNNIFGLCQVDYNKWAVTVTHAKSICFIKMYGTLLSKCEQAIDTSENCRGIACLDSKLFVCCGGIDKEGPGHIKIFDIDGIPIKSIKQDEMGIELDSRPWTAITCHRTNSVYAIVSSNELIKLNARGDAMSVPIHINVQRAKGIAIDELGNLFVADHAGNTVKLFEADGKEIGTILSEKDGINKPLGLAFDCRTLQLSVGMLHSQNILTFQLQAVCCQK